MSSLPKIVIIVGPTATNKTKLAIDLAKAINGQIINADAYQVYQDFSIGVNCPTTQQQSQIKFHLLNCISPTDAWDIKAFQTRANVIIKELLNNNIVPIIVGGSHLYIDALINNYDLSATARDVSFENLTSEELFAKLFAYDQHAATTNKNNRRRLIRALQIYSQGKQLKKRNAALYEYIIISCEQERALLYQRINERVEWMLANGWIHEVKQLINKYPNWESLPAFKALGYSLIAHALINKGVIDKQKIMQLTRNYAKRQITWIHHHYTSVLVFNQKNKDEVIAQIKEWLSK
ncbi:MAG: tRNA (adenosine(37)-N6)-dimethylallyltransferase MiaA [Mycoplasmataceae bacterium]|nr:tRNA (adenosine(37)-N6)-dimethylallyltransferase MiaA [Mycoplasmataceae bacterium]